LAFACNSDSGTRNDSDFEITIDKGKQLYKNYCVSCHGIDGTLGLNGAVNLQMSKLTKEEKINVITNGRKLMLPFKEILKPHEIESITVYIQTFADDE
jgi:mono/diheme cytochrome c family protein